MHTVADKLGAKILGGEFKPGDHLPKEMAARRDFAVSRSAYREAVRTLVGKGLVSTRTRTGATVNDTDDWNLLDALILSWISEAQPASPFIAQLLEMCLLVQPCAAALAARRRTAGDISAMSEAMAGLGATSGAMEETRRAHYSFHSAILAATHNSFFISFDAAIRTAAEVLGFPADQIPDVSKHRKLIDAIREENAAIAFRTMRSICNDATFRCDEIHAPTESASATRIT